MGNVTMKWKKLVIVGVILCLFAVLAAFSAEDVHAANLATGTSGTVKWTISDAGTLTFSPVSGTTGTMGNWEGTDDERPPWIVKCDYDTILKIKSVKTTGTIKLKTGMNLFMCLENATSIDLSGFDSTGITSMFAMFDRCRSISSINLSPLDTSSVTDMSFLFTDCEKLTTINFSTIDTRKVKTMHRMFLSCTSLPSINLTMMRTPNLTNVSEMFEGCTNLKSVNMSTFDTSKVTNFEGMFCVTGLTSLDLSWMNTSSATDMEWMFGDSRELKTVDVSSFNTSKVKSMRCMFDNCFELENLDLSSFNTSSATDMEHMLYDLRGLKTLKLGNWKISQVPADLRAGFPCDMEDLGSGTCYDMDSVIPEGYGRSYRRDYFPGAESSFDYKFFGTPSAYKSHLSKKLSRVYKKIKNGIQSDSEFPIPGLATTYTRVIGDVKSSGSFVPQGICKAGEYILVTAYESKKKPANSVIYVVSEDGSCLYSTITLPHTFHVGGIAFDGSFVWITGNTSDSYLKNGAPFVQYFSYDTLQKKACKTLAKLSWSEMSPQIYIRNKPSFLECDAGKLWVGTYITNDGSDKAYMFGYPIRDGSGRNKLNTDVYAKIYGLPSSAQGADINGDFLYLSSSYKGKDKAAKSSHIKKYNIAAVKNNTGSMDVRGKALSSVEVPKMNEEILIKDSKIFIVFESASEEWKSAVVNTDRVLPISVSLW